MPNTLLEDIKTLDYSHEEVLKILKDKKEADGKAAEEKKKLDEEGKKKKLEQKQKDESNEDDKQKPLDIDISKLAADITESVSKTVSASVSEEIKKQIGLLRGSAPKGTKQDNNLGMEELFVKKNMYEKII